MTGTTVHGDFIKKEQTKIRAIKIETNQDCDPMAGTNQKLAS